MRSPYRLPKTISLSRKNRKDRKRWRNRNQLVKFDLKSGLAQPVTYGYHNVYLSDISEDGKYLLVMKSESRLTERPTTVYSLYRIHADNFEVDTLVTKDGFMDGAQFSPDGKQVLLQGSPEALGGIGNVVPEGRVPSMVDKQLYLMDIRTRQVKPMTKEFNPCVSSVKWCKAERTGRIQLRPHLHAQHENTEDCPL